MLGLDRLQHKPKKEKKKQEKEKEIVTCTFWFLLLYPLPSDTRAYFLSFQHISFTAAVPRLRKANVYVDDRILWWIPQKTSKHFVAACVTLRCNNMKCNLIALTIIKPLFNTVKAGGNFCGRITLLTLVPGQPVVLAFSSGARMFLLFLLQISPIFLCHKIKDGGYNNTNICNESKYCHVTPLLVDLHWLPVKFRIEFKILLIVFKIFTGLAPSYLISTSYSITHKPVSKYNLRSSSVSTLLSYSNVKPKATLGERTFLFAAPKLWNVLPRYIRESISIDTLKRKLKSHLFEKAFCATQIIRLCFQLRL